jgi:hypothetical protein
VRRASAAAVATLVACAVAAVVALPAGGAANSKVTVSIGFHTRHGDPFFKGRVKSGRPACTRNRLVRVFRTKNRRRILFGSDRTDSDGFWRVAMDARMKPAGYIAVAKATSGCLKGSSSQIAVGQDDIDGLGPGGTGQ